MECVLLKLLFIGTIVYCAYIILFQKVILSDANGVVLREVPKGKYDIIVLGRVENDARFFWKFQVFNVLYGEEIPTKPVLFQSTGVSSFKIFTRVAKFKLNAKGQIKLLSSGISKSQFRRSRLILKRIIFDDNANVVNIGIAKRFNYLLFFLLILINISSLMLLIYFSC